MLTAEQNELLTRIGPGTPAGNLLRRYWQPVAATSELEGRWTKRMRLLGEDLVLFRDRQGRRGLIKETCPHRGASLAYGIPTQDGIRCPYHGWEFGHGGECLNQPNERDSAQFSDNAKTAAYPVEELNGMLFAYLGPEPRPLLPRWDGFVAEGSIRMLGRALIPINWLQAMENSLDPIHTEWLHGHTYEFVKEQEGAKVAISARHEKIAVQRIRVRHYQASPARRPFGRFRRLAHRSSGGVPEYALGRQRRREFALLRVPDSRAGRRHPHHAFVVHGLYAAEGRGRAAAPARQGSRL